LADRLAGTPVDAIYSSDLKRARQTAEAVAAVVGSSIRDDKRLREIQLGAWEGMTFDEIRAQDGSALDEFRAHPSSARVPGGESVPEVQRRVMQALSDIVRAHPDGRVAVVSHGLALAAIKVTLSGLPLDTVWNHEPENAAVEVFQLAPGTAAALKGGPG
jgi:broad specificity phosphatase PhoE